MTLPVNVSRGGDTLTPLNRNWWLGWPAIVAAAILFFALAIPPRPAGAEYVTVVVFALTAPLVIHAIWRVMTGVGSWLTQLWRDG